MFRGMWVVLLFLLVACGKDMEDKLDGKWQLREVAEGGVTQKVDTVWYSFQQSLFELRLYDPAKDSARYMSGYRWVENELLTLELATGDTDLVDFLPLIDWEGKRRTFVIDGLEGGDLTLRDGDAIYRFRRY